MKRLIVKENQTNFIGAWNIENDELCKNIISFFQNNSNLHFQGVSAAGKNLNSKKVNNIIKQIELACINIGFFQITGHGISLKKIKNLCNVGNNFFKSTYKNKNKLAPKKWNKNNKK